VDVRHVVRDEAGPARPASWFSFSGPCRSVGVASRPCPAPDRGVAAAHGAAGSEIPVTVFHQDPCHGLVGDHDEPFGSAAPPDRRRRPGCASCVRCRYCVWSRGLRRRRRRCIRPGGAGRWGRRARVSEAGRLPEAPEGRRARVSGAGRERPGGGAPTYSSLVRCGSGHRHLLLTRSVRLTRDRLPGPAARPPTN
jgi:hypothetical protein